MYNILYKKGFEKKCNIRANGWNFVQNACISRVCTCYSLRNSNFWCYGYKCNIV